MAWHKSLPKISICLNVHSVINHNSIPSACDNGGFIFLLFCLFFCIHRRANHALQKASDLKLSLLLLSGDVESVPCSANKFLVNMGQPLGEPSPLWTAMIPEWIIKGSTFSYILSGASVVTGYGTVALHRI